MSVNLKTANYIGQARDFERHGHGTYRYSEDFVYVGNFAQNVKQGPGEFTMPGVFTITGNFVDGEITGLVIKTWVTGNSYEGDLVNGEFHGQGKLKTNRFSYVGQFKHNRFAGRGRLERNDGSVYEGYFDHHKFHGLGEWTRAGVKYVGDFAEGELNGQGVLSGDSWRHEGTFKNGLKHGPGKFVDDRSNFSFSGIWTEDNIENAPAKIVPTISSAQTLQTCVGDKKKKLSLEAAITAPYAYVPVVNVTPGSVLPSISVEILCDKNAKAEEWGRVLELRLVQRFSDGREKYFPSTVNNMEQEFTRWVIAQGGARLDNIQLPVLAKGQYLLDLTDVTACNAPGFARLSTGQVLLIVT
jgi:hypothetical protein